MNTARLTCIWATILCTPLIPVLVLYGFFGNQNYFGLQGWIRGLVAAGPIAAYVFLVQLGWRIFRSLAGVVGSEQSPPSDLLGDWCFESWSADGAKRRKGTCRIVREGHKTVIRGSYRSDDGALLGTWYSKAIHIEDRMLVFLYSLDEVLEGGAKHQEGVCSATLTPGDQARIEGQWRLLGDSVSLGGVLFEKETL
jgi:hypothetical protein